MITSIKNYADTSAINFYVSLKEEKDDSKDFVRFSLFRDLKITSIDQLPTGEIEINLVRENEEFKLVINGNLFLQDKDRNILDRLLKLPDMQFLSWNDVATTSSTWTYNDIGGTELKGKYWSSEPTVKYK